MLHVVSLTDRADEAVEKYSGGMKWRVNIVAGLVHHPQLFFLDEPTVGVDLQSRNHIFESVQRLNRERGMSIVYTSHYMEEVELLCNRVAIIDEGRITALDSIKNLVAMSASALGMLLAAWAKTSNQADSLGTIIGFILAGLGGCIVVFPNGSFMEFVAKFTPHGHALAGFYGLLNNGFGVVDVLPQAGMLVGFTAVFFLAAMWRFRFDS